MHTIRSKADLRFFIKNFRKLNPKKSIGFVPTMGYLHEGHLALIRAARRESDIVVVSIFVNPTQFGPNEDFEDYPRNTERDLSLCEQVQADVVFMPTPGSVYASDHATTVSVDRLTKNLCGAFRPGHFDGVTTIVCKLFSLIQPDKAFFGQKDGQQVIVIKKMIQDLDMDISLVVVPTVREADGLAMSSRNVHLTSTGRKIAPNIYKALHYGEQMVAHGEVRVEKIIAAVRKILERKSEIQIQYLECRDLENLEPMRIIDRPAMLAIAAYIDSVRLIDNVILKPGGKNGSI